MFFPGSDYEAWLQYISVNGGVPNDTPATKKQRARCVGCGRFMSISSEAGAYIQFCEMYSHLKAKCLEKFHAKIVGLRPGFEWDTGRGNWLIPEEREDD